MKTAFAIAAALLGASLSARAAEAVSAAFTFDARYRASGGSPDAWAAYEAAGLSCRFSAETVRRIVDLNANGIPDEWEVSHCLYGAEAAASADPDGDGLTNLQEYNAGTNPLVADDHRNSIAESAACTVDTWIDSTAGDFDLLTEVWSLSDIFATDTAGRAPDSDKDGIPDWWEAFYGLDPHNTDSHLDTDGDGRTNLQEYNAGTNPVVANDWTLSSAESAGSFTTDTRVWYAGGNPAFDETFAVVRGSNGFVCDTGGLYYDWDGDGMPNWWEARFSRDGSKTGLSAGADADGDGFSNYDKFVAYTDPTNAASRFTIDIGLVNVVPLRWRSMSALRRAAASASADETFALQWQSAKGRIYSVYCTDDLAEGFGEIPVAELEGTGGVLQYVPAEAGDAQFFKVSVSLSR